MGQTKNMLIDREDGLTFAGKNAEGEPEFIGTDKEWDEATKRGCPKCGVACYQTNQGKVVRHPDCENCSWCSNE